MRQARVVLAGLVALALLLMGQSQVNGPQPAAGQVAVGKGAAFQLSRAAVINSLGLLDGVTDGSGTDCVLVNGTGAPCGASGSVTSVFGRSGVVVATSGDYSFSLIGGTATADQLPDLAGYNGVLNLSQLAQDAATDGQCPVWSADTSAWAPGDCAGTITSVFGRTGTITAANGDYAFSQLSGSATAGQLPNLSGLNGSLNLSQIAQGGATAAQCLIWSGSDWGPAACAAGGGGSGGAVTSVFGRTGIITPKSGDYSFSLISGLATAAQLPGLSSISGSLLPGQIAQNGATTAQVLAWNGTSWAPGAPGAAGANFSDDETPTQVDALDYTLAHTPNPAASLQVFLNGVLMNRGVDYTITGGSSNTVTFVSYYSELTAPLSNGDVILCWYRY
jgi:hypothetical protein